MTIKQADLNSRKGAQRQQKVTKVTVLMMIGFINE